MKIFFYSRNFILVLILLGLQITIVSCKKGMEELQTNKSKNIMINDTLKELATFGSGCFWCSEAIFNELEGVYSVLPGYSGGKTENPSYEQVCTGTTGHAEVIQITFNPQLISYDELLEVFFKTHDPTSLNRQGNDIGTQYRSVIFYHNDEQKKLAENYISLIEKEKIFDNPIVTEVTKYERFYVAEEYHHNYFKRNPNQGYCSFVINPKYEKFKEVFKDKLKK